MGEFDFMNSEATPEEEVVSNEFDFMDAPTSEDEFDFMTAEEPEVVEAPMSIVEEAKEESGLFTDMATAFRNSYDAVIDDPLGEIQESMKPIALGAAQAINETIKTSFEISDAIGLIDLDGVSPKVEADTRSFQEFITSVEGKGEMTDGKYLPYEDVSGNLTIGRGHLIKKGEDFSQGITEEEAIELQKKDIEIHGRRAAQAVNEKFGKGKWSELNQDQRDMLTDIEYNGQIEKFPKFTQAVIDKDWDTAKKEYKRHATVNGERLELTDRNEQFYDRFLANKGEADAPVPLDVPQIPTEELKYKQKEGVGGMAQVGAEVISQFATSYMGWGKLLKEATVLGKWTKATLQGALADFSGMDAEANNLSKVLRDEFDMDNSVVEALATNPEDPALLNRARNAVEGAGIGMTVEGLVTTAKAFKNWKAVRSSGMKMDALDDITGAPESTLKAKDSTTEIVVKEAGEEGTDRTVLREIQQQELNLEKVTPTNTKNWGESLELPFEDMPPKFKPRVADSKTMTQVELELTGGKVKDDLISDMLDEAYATAKASRELDARIAVELAEKSDGFVNKLAEVTGIPKLYRGIGKMGGKIEEKVTVNMGGLTARPEVRLNTMGKSGNIASEMLNQSERNMKHSYGKYMTGYKATVKTLTTEDKNGLREVLQGIAKPKNANQAQAATKVRDMFNKVMDDAVKAGIYTIDDVTKLKSTNDYWPRMTDEKLLATTKGKNQFIDTFSGKKFSKQQATDIMDNLLHGNAAAKKWFKEEMVKHSDKGSVIFSKRMSDKLFQLRAESRIIERAGHLEKARKLPQWLDEKLNPFMIKESDTVISKYLDEVTSRIESAKIFGKNDENYNRLLKEIAGETGEGLDGRSATFWRNTYATHVSDGSNSDYMMATAKMTAGQRKVLDQADALQTYKLSLAQILNVGQVFVNAPTYLGRQNNVVKAYGMTLKGLVRSFGEDGAEIAARSGAAAESIAMEMAGEATQYNKLFGVGPSPSQFLKWTGFTAVEKWNRKFAANIGKVYFEDLMAKKLLIDQGKLTGKKAANVHKALRELQVDPTVAVKDMDDFAVNSAAETAAGAFSDKINFTNSATQMPLLWRHPYARLTRKFKTFMFHQGVIFKETVLKEAYKGNFNPMVAYLMAGPMIGLPVATVREFIVGDDKEYTNVERLAKGYTTIGATGIFLDAMGGVTSGYGPAAVGVLAGPMGSDLVKWATTATDMATYTASAAGADAGTGVHPAIGAARTVLQIPGGFPGKRALQEALKEENKLKNKPFKKKRKKTNGGNNQGYGGSYGG